MFTLPPQYPSPLPPAFAGAALLADRVEGLLTRFCDSHPDENPELLIRAARAIWNLTAVRKTIYLLTNPGADRRHRRKPDATMTYIEHRVAELHDWVAEYQRLVRAMKKDPTQFTVTPTPSGTYNIQHIENIPAPSNPQPTTRNPQPNSSDSPSPGTPVSAPAPPPPTAPLPSNGTSPALGVPPSGGFSNNSSSTEISPLVPSILGGENSSPSPSSSAPLRFCVENSSTPVASPSASSASLRFNSSPLLPSPLPNHMNTTPPLRNPLGTALATARETVAIAHEAQIPFDRTNFFPTEIDPAAAIADAHAYQQKSNQSQNPCPPPETITFRNRQVTLTGKPLPPNDLPELPKIPNPRKSAKSENPCSVSPHPHPPSPNLSG